MAGPTDGGSLYNTSRDFRKYRGLPIVFCAVRMSLEKIQKPVIDILWDFKLGYFVEES